MIIIIIDNSHNNKTIILMYILDNWMNISLLINLSVFLTIYFIN